jgi:hypothetical protein
MAVALLVAFGYSDMSRADEHLVSGRQRDARLTEAVGSRVANLERVDAVLSIPEARRAASLLGIDVDVARRSLAQLGDAELHDLAARAHALQTDPAAGTGAVPVVPGWVVVGALVVIVALIVGLVLGIKAIVD